MRRFRLVRLNDVSGISGTGVVCQGVMFDDGKVVTRWIASIAQTCVWDSIDNVLSIHGHNGSTVLKWIDNPTRIELSDIKSISHIRCLNNPETSIAVSFKDNTYVCSSCGEGLYNE
jgi:hypothetical protein